MTLTAGSDASCTERDPAELSGAWSALAARRSPPSIFLTPEWIGVVRAHDASEQLTIAFGEPVRGIAALARDADGTLRLAGGELTDEQDLIAARGSEEEAGRAVASWIARETPPRVSLDYVPEDGPTLELVAAALRDAGYSVSRSRIVASPRLALPRDFESYLRGLGKKERHELGRKIRRVEATAHASFRWADDTERAPVLERFFALHRLSRGTKASFMTAETERFFRDVADALGSVGRLRLGVLTVHGDDVAVLFTFAYAGTLALYNAAYDPALSSLSIGMVSHAWAIREAIAEGFDTYDLLRGVEAYKYDLGATDRWLGRLVATRA